MKHIFMAVIFVLLSIYSNACSICGCGGGNLYLGLYPSFKTKFIGIKYNYSEFHTLLKNNNTQFSHNYYHSTEIWYGMNLGKKWQIIADIPYYFNNQVDDDSKKSIQGIGDISLIASYKLIHKQHTNKKLRDASHELWIGAGLKLKTGKFNVDPNDPNTTLADINTQIGTGSNDLLLNARDNIQFGKFGIASSINERISSKNPTGYEFGNKLTINSIAFYNLKLGAFIVSPNTGFQFEHIGDNKLNGSKVILKEGLNNGSYFTGGYTLNMIWGVEVNWKQISIGANIQNPLKQNFAASQTNMAWRGMIHLSYAL